MYDELVKQCRDCIDCLCGDCKYEHLQKPGNFVQCMNALLGETADAIEELENQIVELNKMVPKWIPVMERLPEDKERVLIFYWLSTKPKTPWYKVATFATKLCDVDKYDLCGKDHPGFYGCDSECGYYEHTDVEYWMPLPEPPKEET